jgi:hypothetical protein
MNRVSFWHGTSVAIQKAVPVPTLITGPIHRTAARFAALVGAAVLVGALVASTHDVVYIARSATNAIAAAHWLACSADGAPCGLGGDGATSCSPTAGGSCYGCDTTTRAGECGAGDGGRS